MFALKRAISLQPSVIRLLLIFTGFIIFLLLLFYLLKLIEPTSAVQNLFLSNITDQRVSISWITDKATKGVVILSEDNDFPLLPIFAKEIHKDDGEKSLKRQRFYTTHHVTTGSLAPSKTYYFRIYQGWKKVFQGSFTTNFTPASLPFPEPVYGRVLHADKKTPVVGALVYLQVENQASRSALLSTLTNSEGRWSLDLGSLKEFISSSSAEKVVVETGGKGKFKATTIFGQDKPWPDIILK